MTNSKRKGLTGSLILIFVILLLDQILKIWVRTHMSVNEEISVLGDWFKLHYIENAGMAFGWLAQ